MIKKIHICKECGEPCENVLICDKCLEKRR